MSIETLKPRYQLRRTEHAFMIDKLVADQDFEPPIWIKAQTFGPFPSKQHATRFMLKHEGRP